LRICSSSGWSQRLLQLKARERYREGYYDAP
jgi:hypothetical protein